MFSSKIILRTRTRSNQVRIPSRTRRFSVSVVAFNVPKGLARDQESQAVEETEDLKELERLLKVVKARADPTFHTVIPVRGSIPWAQALLDAARPASSTLPKKAPMDLPSRSMHDSYTETFLPFASDPALLEQYTNASGGIRTGKLFEHLDSLAGSISYKHVLGPSVETLGKLQEKGFYIVTAAVDRLDMLSPLHPVRDVRLSGHVIHVGSSSMEVAVKMEALEEDGREMTVMLGRFSMVCRDAFTHKAHPVNQLKVTTPEEQALYTMGELHKKKRQTNMRRSLKRVPPSSEEAKALHAFELKYGRTDWDRAPHDEERVWLEDTKLERTMLMFPQERNVHQKIFGGFLMRLAYELGFTTSRLFTRQPVRFLSLDSISFARPVPIGSILRLTSKILHTTSDEEGRPVVHVRVKADVVDVESGIEQMTNDFRFTWCAQGGGIPRKVVPKTYREAMQWLEGRRALEVGAAIRGLRKS